MFEKIAFAAPEAQSAAANPMGPLGPLPMFVIIIAIFYFFLIRPQQKRQQTLKQMVENLKKGDRVIVSGGIIGTITSIQNDYVVIKTGDSDGMKMEVLKSGIIGLRTQE